MMFNLHSEQNSVHPDESVSQVGFIPSDSQEEGEDNGGDFAAIPPPDSSTSRITLWPWNTAFFKVTSETLDEARRFLKVSLIFLRKKN
jgi:hypothetical protein